MYLTVQEIIDLAEFSGLKVISELNDEELETEITIGADCNGIEIADDEGVVEKYRAAARCDGCDYDELQPLGKPLDV
jgi:hypothetical protein